MTSEEYLRAKYGAYRGHPFWRALEEAFNAGGAAGAAAEREACAKVCEEHWHIDGEHTAYEFARAIRARGQS